MYNAIVSSSIGEYLKKISEEQFFQMVELMSMCVCERERIREREGGKGVGRGKKRSETELDESTW